MRPDEESLETFLNGDCTGIHDPIALSSHHLRSCPLFASGRLQTPFTWRENERGGCYRKTAGRIDSSNRDGEGIGSCDQTEKIGDDANDVVRCRKHDDQIGNRETYRKTERDRKQLFDHRHRDIS